MRCSYRECQAEISHSDSNIVMAGNANKTDRVFCDRECRNNEIVAAYADLLNSGKRVRSSSFPISSRSFGNALLQEGVITAYQLEKAIELKTMNGGRPLAYYLMKKAG
jgi:hypothetical protein